MRPDRGRVRSCAACVVDQTLESKRPVDRYLAEFEDSLAEVDRRLLYQLVLGTIRWLRRIDYVIECASNRTIEQIDPELRAPLRIGSFEILFLDRIPTYAAVNEAVEEARRRTHSRGAAFVNAVLRKISRRPEPERWPVKRTDPLERLAIESSHPDFLVRRWAERFGVEETRRLVAINNQPKPLHLLTFVDRGGRDVAAADLAQEGVAVRPSGLSRLGLVVEEGAPFGSEVFRRGDLYAQDEASQASALIPLPEVGESVLDLAAAPGGKTFALHARQPEVRTVSADVSLRRLLVMQGNARRMRRPLALVVADTLQPAFRSGFDRVVVDLPCSGTGTLRKNPELKWRIDAAALARLTERGLEMVRAAATLPRIGGQLVVISCSLESEESTGVVESLIEQDGGYELVNLDGMFLETGRNYLQGPGFWRVLPADDHDGFTVHLLRRTG